MKSKQMSELREKDKVWVIWDGLLVRCSITHVDLSFRKINQDAVVEYWVDEPVGHGIQEGDELHRTYEEAIKEIKDRKEDGWYEESPDFIDYSLEQMRDSAKEFIAETQQKAISEINWPLYPDKKEGIEWFYISKL